MLTQMTERNGSAGSTEQCSKEKLNKFHETFCKTGINPEGLVQVTPKVSSNMTSEMKR